MRFRPRLVDRATFREVAGYSGQAFAAMLAGRLAFHTDAFVLGPILGPAAITIFSFPARLVEMGKAVLRQGTTTLTSRFSLLEANDDLAAIRSLFLIGTRVAWYCAVPIQLGLYLLGRPFLALWLGESYAVVCTPVLYILATTLPLTIAQSVGARVLYGTGQLRGFAFATLAEGVTNLALSLALIGPFGVPGVALGTAIPHACFCVYVIVTVSRRLGVGGGDYFDGMARPLVAGVVPGLVWWWLASRGVTSMVQMMGIGVAGVVAYCVVVLMLERALRAPLRKAFASRLTGHSAAR